jgi:hypothetical protein
MTIAIAWVRKVKGCEELIVASDSRLSGGGMVWDQCAKIMTLPRSDSVICFAGETVYAYPLMTQLSIAINSYSRSRERAMDLHDMRGYAIKVFNALQQSIQYTVKGVEISNNEFIIGGYSWIRKAFAIWLIHYNKAEKLFRMRPARRLIGKFDNIVFAGDKAKIAKQNLRNLLQSRYGSKVENYTGAGFDMEPFEVVRDLISETDINDTIGGPPQVVKVYQHMNARPVGVYWPNKESGQITVLGRTVFEFEDLDYWLLDPYGLTTSAHSKLDRE